MLRIKYFILGFLLVGSFTNNGCSKVTEEKASWKYLVERTTTLQDNLANKKDVHIDRAFVYYGAGAKQAGGQMKEVPQVVYIDEDKNRFPRAVYYASAFEVLDSKKLTLTGKLRDDIGSDSDLPLQAGILVVDFSILPLKPKDELKKGLSWSSTLYLFYGMTPDFPFRVTIEHEVKGYEQKKGRRCALIEYTIAGDLKMSDHPEWFTEEELHENKSGFGLKGGGIAYFDPEEEIIVEKDQTISWTRFGEKLWRFEDGKVGWKPTVDEKTTVTISVSLIPEEQTTSSLPEGTDLPVKTYVLILSAAGIVIAGLILLLKKKAGSRGK